MSMVIASRGIGAAVALLATACSASPAAEGEDEGYVTPGKLTIATGEIAYEPYVIGDDPASGEGFEAAVAYAVAEELGIETVELDAEIADFTRVVGRLCAELGVAPETGGGYRLIVNAGQNGGQEVPHLHVHILGGRGLGRMLQPA